MKRLFCLFLFVFSLVVLPQQEAKKEIIKEFLKQSTTEKKLSFFYQLDQPFDFLTPEEWLQLNRELFHNPSTSITLPKGGDKLIKAYALIGLGETKDAEGELNQVPDSNDTILKYKLLTKAKYFNKLQLYDKQLETLEQLVNKGYRDDVPYYEIYESMGLYQKALEKFIIQEKPKIDPNNYDDLAHYYYKVGALLLKDNSLETAIPAFEKGIQNAKRFLNNLELPKSKVKTNEIQLIEHKCQLGIGIAQLQMGQFDNGITRLNTTIDQLDAQWSNPNLTAQARLILANGYHKTNNFELCTKTLEGVELDLLSNQDKIGFIDLKMTLTPTSSVETFRELYQQKIRLLEENLSNKTKLLDGQIGQIVGNAELENSRKVLDELKASNQKIREEIKAKDERIYQGIVTFILTLLAFVAVITAFAKSLKNTNVIKRQNAIIADALKEKDSLLKEIHHRVKNNLQMVSSLLSLQSRNTKSKEAIAALEEGKSRVQAMALIHQKLYQNEDLSVVEMQGYVESLINSIQSVYKKGGHDIDIHVNAQGIELDIDRAIPFGLILNELVSNSFKYAFPHGEQNAEIHIRFWKDKKEDRGGYFEYADNGVGMPQDADDNLHQSMGLRLISRLVNQLQAKLGIDKKGPGVRFWFYYK